MEDHLDTWLDSKPWRYSNNFQWLPCDVAFSDRRGEGDESGVEITSYINNLHPTRNRDLYALLSEIIGALVPCWEEVLTPAVPGYYEAYWLRIGDGRVPPRIRTFGIPTALLPTPPDGVYWDDRDSFYSDLLDLSECWSRTDPAVRDSTFKDILARMEAAPKRQFEGIEGIYQRIHEEMRPHFQYMVHPEPGTLFSYEDWKAGKGTGRAIVPQVGLPARIRRYVPHDDDLNELTQKYQDNLSLYPSLEHARKEVDLRRSFGDKGLQVYVEIERIELGPDSVSRLEAADWTLEGKFNEHIAATSIVCFSADNVTTPSYAFRVVADFSQQYFPAWYETNHAALAAAFEVGTPDDSIWMVPHLQDVGSVTAPVGRPLSFPSTLQHRRGPIELLDPTKPGHVHLLKIHLADPWYRVVSTSRVAPQQFDWWLEDCFPDAFLKSCGLPAELREGIRAEVGGAPFLSREEAAEFRDRMERERARLMMEVNRAIYYRNFDEP
ncbi:unnamed protein product [Parascedosporium putredinis]|uniref:DUF4246 domain-containing protein n=1 Tax=Parascedosporium putredinis TaxID=1442378 RepID=A0A9P1M6X6_9PEZI|nr:unnamed protein product [Parascedosporium putredinis]CAI7989339.1 unnamed protein product [Parascedosporium putredinis]